MSAAQALAVFIIRIWAIGAIIFVFFAIAAHVGNFIGEDALYAHFSFSFFGYLQLGSEALKLAFWLVILGYAKSLSVRALPPRENGEKTVQVAAADIVRFVTFLIGVFYVTEFVPDMLRSTASHIGNRIQTSNLWGIFQDAGFLLSLSVSLASIGVALWLMRRPDHLVGLYRRLQTAGPGAPAPESAGPE